jgi:hypothetical protein
MYGFLFKEKNLEHRYLREMPGCLSIMENYHEYVEFILRNRMHIKGSCREQTDNMSYVHIRHIDSFISYI